MRFLVIVHYTDPAARERAVAGHRAYLAEARTNGVVVESGPFLDGKGGMYVLQMPDESAAQAFVEADPYRKAGLRLELRAFDSAIEKRDGRA